MNLSEDDIKLISSNESSFASFKYLSDDGFLKQIDFSSNALKNNIVFVPHGINLYPIKSKAFLDPFRSVSTTSFYCENRNSKMNTRKEAERIYASSSHPSFNEYFAEISFWIETKLAKNNKVNFVSDSIDPYANLRADIISTLEAAGIESSYHYKGKTNNESVIAIKGKTVIDLADNIVIAKFIIANVSISYAMNANFTYDENINLKLFLKSKQTEIDAVYASLAARSKQVSAFCTKSKEHFFEIKEIHHYKVDSDVILQLELTTLEQFIPYLCLVDLLSYEINSKMINKELLSLFKK
jgi:hypothetical protein